jgi:cell division protein FtsN
MRTRQFTHLIMMLILAGCGSSSDTDREWMNIPPMDTTVQARKTTFETRTDTIDAEGAQPKTQTDAAVAASAELRFTVQIGSFTDAKNASLAQAAARQRYQLPVVNDYDAQRRRYQIRIGFFESKEAAGAFCAKLKSDFPLEYKDAWVAPINK